MRLKRGEGLNIIPFIDIMLVLLAIVLSVSTFITQGQIPIQVPQADHSQTPKDEKKLTITINAQNQIYLDKRAINLEELEQALLDVTPKTLIELRSDRESRFDSFIQILNLLKAKNHENFAISTQKN